MSSPSPVGCSAEQLRRPIDARGPRYFDRHRPLHLSIVGRNPLVRFREIEALLPLILAKGVHMHLLTSAFRPLPAAWPNVQGLNIVVSIDGLREEYDVRRAPATYEWILKNIEGRNITLH